MLFTALSLAALLILALFLSKFCRVPVSVAPLTAAAAVMLWFSAFACADLLFAGGVLFFILCAALLVVCVLGRRRSDVELLTEPAFAAFAILCAVLLLLFAFKQPLYTTWDEYSFWGTAGKIVKISNTLYTTGEIGWAWAATQKPGLILLTYFFEFFGSYAPWRAIYAYDVLLLACFSAAAGLVPKKKWYLTVLCMLVCILVPFVCVLIREADYPSYVYMTVLSDIPMGALFGGTICSYYVLSRDEGPLYPLSLQLAALTFVRDTAFPLALIAAFVMAADLLVPGRAPARSGRSLPRRLGRSAALFAVPPAAFIAWVIYLKVALDVSAVGDLGGSENIGMVEMLVQGVLQLLGIGTTEKYATVMSNMLRQFWTLKMSLLGTGLTFTVCILLLLAVAALFSDEALLRRRCILFGVCAVIGFAAFYLFNGFCFAFIFKPDVYTTLVGYERYLFPYYIGWLIVAVSLLAAAAAGRQRFLPGAQGLLLFAVAGAFFWRITTVLAPGYSFIDYNRNSLSVSYDVLEKAESVQETLGDTHEQIFFISQGDNGGLWFEYSCALLPLQLNYSYGGGTLCLPEDAAVDTIYAIRLTQEELCEYLRAQDCRYIFVERADEALRRDYGALFSDGLSLCDNNGSALYKITGQADAMRFEPVAEVTARGGEARK